MPSQTFLNLDKAKQNKLLNSSMDEFNNYLYPDVSINRIIMNAGISRGSFYMYFADKDDLFEYLVDINRQRLILIFKDIFIKNNGDLYDSFSDLYDALIKFVFEENYKLMFKNIFIYFNMHKKQFEKPGYDFFVQVKDLIDTKNVKGDELEFIFIMILHTLFMSITYVLDNDILDNKDIYLKKLNILCHGIYDGKGEI